MRRYLVSSILAVFCLILSNTACQSVTSQTRTTQNKNSAANTNQNSTFQDRGNAYPIDAVPVTIGEEYYAVGWLKSDYKEADIVAYIDSKEVVSTDRSDEQTDCVNFSRNTGYGYCSFTMRAEIKELYKGKLRSRAIEYSEYGEGRNIKSRDQFLGEQVVFLERHKSAQDGSSIYQVIENSTRDINYKVLEKMRKISKFRVRE
ncbi:MAG: hypothetical protein HOP17_10085 [Acidobacteria bacterium]|nr:hypothetical protein [Acidobacteriota bacterium]